MSDKSVDLTSQNCYNPSVGSIQRTIPLRAADFEWDEQNMDHIARHGVEPDEAESLLDGVPLILRTEDGKYLAYGQTDEGRYLLVGFVRKSAALIRVISARDMTDGEKKRHRRRK